MTLNLPEEKANEIRAKQARRGIQRVQSTKSPAPTSADTVSLYTSGTMCGIGNRPMAARIRPRKRGR